MFIHHNIVMLSYLMHAICYGINACVIYCSQESIMLNVDVMQHINNHINIIVNSLLGIMHDMLLMNVVDT